MEETMNSVLHSGVARMRSLAVASLALSLAVVYGAPAQLTRWSIVSSPNEEGWNWLTAVDASAGDSAWAVGYYIDPNAELETLAERWDGSAWTLVQTPNVDTNGGQL